MRSIRGTVCLLWLITASLFAAPGVTPGRVGFPVVGLDALGPKQLPELAADLANAGGDLEVAALGFVFNTNNPFTNFTTLVQATLPNLAGHLTITTYLDDGPKARSKILNDQSNREGVIHAAILWSVKSGQPRNPHPPS